MSSFFSLEDLSISSRGGHACAATTLLRMAALPRARLPRAAAACSLAAGVPPKERSITSGSTAPASATRFWLCGALVTRFMIAPAASSWPEGVPEESISTRLGRAPPLAASNEGEGGGR